MIKSAVIVAHKYVTQPDDELVYYLNENKYENVIHIRHSFNDYPDRKSYLTWYKEGKIYKEISTRDFKNWPEPLIYAKELFFTVKWIVSPRSKYDMYVGMDGLCVLFGNILRTLGSVSKTIFWSMDFVPKGRFNSGIKEFIYHEINKLGYKESDEMWDISPRMIEAREKFFGIKNDFYKKHRVVPYGVWMSKIPHYSYDECDRNCIVFMGHLIEKQGVQLIISALSKILKVNPNVKFKIIGGGSYSDSLKKLSYDLGVSDKCNFLGRLPDHALLQKEIASSCIAVAPYIKNLDTWTYYADPGKIKEYLACGVPVLFTPLPWNTDEIVSNNCGVVITENTDDIATKAIDLMKKENNAPARSKSIEYAYTFDYKNIFDKLFKDA